MMASIPFAGLAPKRPRPNAMARRSGRVVANGASGVSGCAGTTPASGAGLRYHCSEVCDLLSHAVVENREILKPRAGQTDCRPRRTTCTSTAELPAQRRRGTAAGAGRGARRWPASGVRIAQSIRIRNSLPLDPCRPGAADVDDTLAVLTRDRHAPRRCSRPRSPARSCRARPAADVDFDLLAASRTRQRVKGASLVHCNYRHR